MRLSLSGDQPITLAAAATSSVPADLQKEHKGAVKGSLDRAAQLHLPLSGVPSVTSAAAAVSSKSAPKEAPAKGGVPDVVLQHFRLLSSELAGDLSDKTELAGEVLNAKIEGEDIESLLDGFLLRENVFFRELVVIAYNSNSEAQALSRMANFEARVAKLCLNAV